MNFVHLSFGTKKLHNFDFDTERIHVRLPHKPDFQCCTVVQTGSEPLNYPEL